MRSSGSLQHRTQVCTGDHAGIAAEPAGLDVGLGRNVLCLALGQHLVADLQRDLCVGDINTDGIALLDQADGAAGSSLGADVADGRAAGCAGEAASYIEILYLKEVSQIFFLEIQSLLPSFEYWCILL